MFGYTFIYTDSKLKKTNGPPLGGLIRSPLTIDPNK